ncbi:MAG: CdaR family protein [Mariprofundaceae bacterium]|nr:CdaR family protein [Mariprofundaceae bacterium]
MDKMLSMLKPLALYVWAVLIAVVLWVQVHGEGEGSLSLEVALQVQGLPADMVIVNNLPNQVRLTVKGLQARLKVLQASDIFVPLNARDLSKPGVIERPLNPEDVRLPAGLVVESIQPDLVQLQVDRIVTRTVAVHPQFDLPQGWHVEAVSVEPVLARLQGPEVWLEVLNAVETVPIRLELKAGAFELKVDVSTPAGKAVHLEKNKGGFVVRGVLLRDAPSHLEAGVINDLGLQGAGQ